MTEQLDTRSEAREALTSLVTNYSKRILSDPRMLGNIVTDLLPDLPRERRLLVTAAEANVAGDLTRLIEENHLDPETAISLVARSLSDRTAIDPAASMWVTSEYAQALGYHVRSHASPPLPGPQSDPAGGGYPGYSQPQPTGQQTWLQPTPPAPPTPPTKKRNLGPILAAGGVAVAVVVFFAVAAVAKIPPFSSAKPAPTASPTHHPTPPPTHQPSASPSPLTSGVAPLSQLLPSDIDDPSSQCSAFGSTKWATPGLVQSLSCTDPGLPSGSDVAAFQLSSPADYQTSWQSLNSYIGFNTATKGTSCPPPSGDAAGTTNWKDQYFPYRAGQVLECGTFGSGSSAQPAYIWSFPTENAYVIALDAPGASFSSLNTWWTNNSTQLNPPTPATPSP